MKLRADVVTVLLVLLVVGALAGGPWWPYSANWGYWPSGSLFGLILLVLLIKAI